MTNLLLLIILMSQADMERNCIATRETFILSAETEKNRAIEIQKSKISLSTDCIANNMIIYKLNNCFLVILQDSGAKESALDCAGYLKAFISNEGIFTSETIIGINGKEKQKFAIMFDYRGQALVVKNNSNLQKIEDMFAVFIDLFKNNEGFMDAIMNDKEISLLHTSIKMMSKANFIDLKVSLSKKSIPCEQIEERIGLSCEKWKNPIILDSNRIRVNILKQ